MSEHTSEELLVLMQFQDTDPIEARAAFDEFFRRHKDHLWEVCMIFAKKASGYSVERTARFLFQQTLLRVYESQKSKGAFDTEKTTDKDTAIDRWLYGIARYAFLEFIKTTTKTQPVFIPESIADEEKHPFFEFTDNEPLPLSLLPEMSALKEALASLNEKEREIILLTYEFQERGKLPTEIRRQLCQKHGLADASFNKTRTRALARLLQRLVKLGYEVPKKILPYASQA